MRIISLINSIVGATLAIEAVVLFVRISDGGVWEPDHGIARAELILAVCYSLWFIWQIPYWFIKAVKK